MSKVKVGVFGAHRGMTMIRQLLNSPDAEVTAICDKFRPSLDAAGKAAEDAGLKVALYERFDDFFQHDMDAVVLANYANEHAPYAVRLLKSGRHVMSEVLTCATLAEAVALIEAVEESGRIYQYAENYCFFNTTAEMRRLYRAGDIGELMYAEGEYIHDCSSIWPGITYGERDHWRNRMSSTFYCTHSLGPILHATGLRPIRVGGYEGQQAEFMRKLGERSGSCGIEMVTLENGALVKSIHGGLKREPGSINYEMYGTHGSMETERWDRSQLHVWRETTANCVGSHEKYAPTFSLEGAEGTGHGGSDYFTTYYFVRSILGDEAARAEAVDVYRAVDMCIPGILAYRSILTGKEEAVPDLRLPEERDKVRGDTFCTFAEIAGDQYVSSVAAQWRQEEIGDAVYAEVRRKWLAGEQG